MTQTVYGAYEKVGSLPDGVHFQVEDNGVLANGGTDMDMGGMPNMAGRMASMNM